MYQSIPPEAVERERLLQQQQRGEAALRKYNAKKRHDASNTQAVKGKFNREVKHFQNSQLVEAVQWQQKEQQQVSHQTKK